MLTTDDHRRDSAGLLYVYPVISRRAGGVSVGINLNPNNACNWACVYCQVENLTRGGPPPIDLQRLEQELHGFLDQVLHGDFLARHVPLETRQLVDIAFSGNGEPTSATEFAEAVACVGKVIERFDLKGKIPIRLITNGSLFHRNAVQLGVRYLAELGGEVWFKIDRATDAEVVEVNGVRGNQDRVLKNLQISAKLAPTWVQTCWFRIDGEAPTAQSRQAYCTLLRQVNDKLAGVHLYGLARPSKQEAAPRLSSVTEDELMLFSCQIEEETGIRVVVSP
ncbi:radical SAM protein [Dechloromonas agitata]|uniref:radical SAM protein n=1 Tax=Dechloromonas agitata TaxID=73030 RepID=UPI0004BA3C88|nr:radical SAM protein [Dechloromonas agitata]MDE1547320.1 radical SAM protein [Dechloromonas agitata]